MAHPLDGQAQDSWRPYKQLDKSCSFFITGLDMDSKMGQGIRNYCPRDISMGICKLLESQTERLLSICCR